MVGCRGLFETAVFQVAILATAGWGLLQLQREPCRVWRRSSGFLSIPPFLPFLYYLLPFVETRVIVLEARGSTKGLVSVFKPVAILGEQWLTFCLMKVVFPFLRLLPQGFISSLFLSLVV